ncbi:type II toxin-antitoxin system RelE/ParE family toxin [Mesorhizobium sp. M0701]|uniref:type II toxin-antitoxin system RelE/ParE family toxin n=1 Tax=Mesorhizobium sp. M0701 TaxID=2956989 RepID=UPI003336CC59
MTRTVVFSAQAERQLDALYRYIEEYSSTARAESFVGGIVAYCHAFEPFPERGTRRDDIRPGLRVLGYRRRVSIAFTAEADTIAVLGVYYGGQEHEADLKDEG